MYNLSELKVKVNCRLKVNGRIKFGMVYQLLAKSAQILSYNSLSAVIHLYMIQTLELQYFSFCEC